MEPLAPGATYSFSVVIPDTPARERILRIPALVFADGAVEGDPGEIAFIKAYRLGTALETERINRVVESFGTGEVLKNASVAAVMEAVGMPPGSADEAVESIRPVSGNRAAAFEAAIRDQKTRAALRSGVSGARQNVRRQLAEIGAQPAPSGREPAQGAPTAGTPKNLSDFETRIRALIAKQKAELEAMQ